MKGGPGVQIWRAKVGIYTHTLVVWWADARVGPYSWDRCPPSRTPAASNTVCPPWTPHRHTNATLNHAISTHISPGFTSFSFNITTVYLPFVKQTSFLFSISDGLKPSWTSVFEKSIVAVQMSAISSDYGQINPSLWLTMTRKGNWCKTQDVKPSAA